MFRVTSRESHRRGLPESGHGSRQLLTNEPHVSPMMEGDARPSRDQAPQRRRCRVSCPLAGEADRRSCLGRSSGLYRQVLLRFDRQISIHDHHHLAGHAAARLQRLQPGIDRLDGAVDSPAEMRHHQPLQRPLHRQSHVAVEEALASSSRVVGSEK